MVDVDTVAVLRPPSAASPVPPCCSNSVGCSASPPTCATRSADNDLLIAEHVCVSSLQPAAASSGGIMDNLSMCIPLAATTPSSPSSTVSADANAIPAIAVVKIETPECAAADAATAADSMSSTSSTTCNTPPSPIAHLEDYGILSSPTPSPLMEDYGMAPSSPSPSPMIDEAGVWMNLDHAHHMQVDDLDPDARTSMKTLGLGHLPDTTSCTREGSCSSGDMFVSQLDELLGADLAESAALPLVDDFFPGKDFPPLSGWAEESGCDAGVVATGPSVQLLQAGNISGEQESSENVAQLFAQWLKSNSHCISLVDLRKVKLRMSTIENATRRLGGGKKGLLQFLKFVLLWVQNCHMRRMRFSGNMIDSALNSSSDAIAFHPSTVSGASKVATTGCLLREDPTMDPYCTHAGSSTQAALIDRNGGVMKNYPYPNTNHSSSWEFSMNNQPWPFRECSGATSSSNNSSPREGGLRSANMRGFSAEFGTWQQHQGNVTQQLRASLQDRANLTTTNCTNLGGSYTTSQGFVHSQSPSFAATNCSSSLMRISTPAATTRAARKSRMERQRWSVRRHQHHQHHRNSSNNSNNATRAGWMPSGSITVAAAQTNGWSSSYSSNSIGNNDQRLAKPSLELMQQQGRKTERNLKLLFQKELKQSDVGNLGRIVLPKKAAETSLPPLELRDGVNLVVEDLNSSKLWNMRYRFWPNNKSRMYLLENTGDFVKSYNLKEGDIMMLYRNITTNKYAIKGAKSEHFGKAAASMDLGTVDQTKREPGKGTFGYSGLTMAEVGNNPSCNIFAAASETTCNDDALLAELIEQSLENI